MKTINSPLEWLRTELRLKKVEMAKLLSIASSTYGQMEKGDHGISKDKISVLVRELHVNPLLFTNTPPKDQWPKMLNYKPETTDMATDTETEYISQNTDMLYNNEELLQAKIKMLIDELKAKNEYIKSLELQIETNSQKVKKLMEDCKKIGNESGSNPVKT